MARGRARILLKVILAVVISAVATAGVSLSWSAIGGGDLPLHGWIALTLGMFGTVGLAWGLMALAFKSDREGWDDRVDDSRDPARGETGDGGR